MTHAHRRQPAPHRYDPPRFTVLAGLVAAGVVAVGVSVGLLVTADDAEAAPRLPAVVVCGEGGGVMRCAPRDPLWPLAEDYQTYLEALAARTGGAVGLAVSPDAALLSAP